MVQLPGQASVAPEVLAPVLDDAAVAWSMLVHDARVQLVRVEGTAARRTAGPSKGLGGAARQRPIPGLLLNVHLL